MDRPPTATHDTAHRTWSGVIAVPAKTLQEFIALAKSQPGKLNYASSGQGTPYHMAGELFKTMAGIDVVHVPYRNSGEARSGVIGGQVQMMIDALPAKCRALVLGSVGVDSVDVAAATARGIPVTNCPDTFIEEVADHAMALLLSCQRRLIEQALQRVDGTVAHAARLLNLRRTTLVEKLRKLGITTSDSTELTEG